MLEFNCRMGDPETQPIMMRLKSDLLRRSSPPSSASLDRAEAEWDRRAALGVVLAAHGYPDAPRKGDAIRGLQTCRPREAPGKRLLQVFHSGHHMVESGEIVTPADGSAVCRDRARRRQHAGAGPGLPSRRKRSTSTAGSCATILAIGR